MADELSHLTDQGEVHMVEVGDRAITKREATAAGTLVMQPSTLELVLRGDTPKGDLLAVARIAAIQGAKRTSELIPLCHPLPISGMDISIEPDPSLPGLKVQASCRTTGQTGVEMEALTAASVAALTIYDMLKAADKAMRIEAVRLVRKSGGRSGDYEGS